MITRSERAILSADFRAARDLWIYRAKHEAGRIADSARAMLDKGFERVEVTGAALLTDDGREVLRAHGKTWALKPEIHALRVAEAMERARQRSEAMAAQQQPATPSTTCAALIDGQLCGGTLINAPVCPRCALGKSGVAATLTCDVCGHVTVIMRGAK